jgi:hypothetical protein
VLSCGYSWWLEVSWNSRVDSGGARWKGERRWGARREECEREVFDIELAENKDEHEVADCGSVARGGMW